jgi:hypothetical protein
MKSRSQLSTKASEHEQFISWGMMTMMMMKLHGWTREVTITTDLGQDFQK